MNRRRQADRAEAIVRGVGALFLLLVLLFMVKSVPQALNGTEHRDAIGPMLQMLRWLVALAGLVVIVGLIVWFKVRKWARRSAVSKSASGQE